MGPGGTGRGYTHRHARHQGAAGSRLLRPPSGSAHLLVPQSSESRRVSRCGHPAAPVRLRHSDPRRRGIGLRDCVLSVLRSAAPERWALSGPRRHPRRRRFDRRAARGRRAPTRRAGPLCRGRRGRRAIPWQTGLAGHGQGDRSRGVPACPRTGCLMGRLLGVPQSSSGLGSHTRRTPCQTSVSRFIVMRPR